MFTKLGYFGQLVINHLEQMSASFSLKEMLKCARCNQIIDSKYSYCNQQKSTYAFYSLHSENFLTDFQEYYFSFFKFHKYLMN